MKTETIILRKTDDNRPWEGCVNSVNYRIERGVPVEVPCFIAELIRHSENERFLSDKRLRCYECAAGMKLA